MPVTAWFVRNRVKTAVLGTASLIALTVGAPALAQVSGAQTAPAAQSTTAADTTTVIVTGMRRSLQAGTEIKKNSPDVVDSIVPEDVGKLPDLTVGDALQRITGVQVTRNNNQVIGVNIRGLPNVETTLNGDEIFTTSGRVYDFQNMPSEVLSGLNVYKSSSADQIEGGIAGLVDIQMHRPFDFKGLQIAGSFSGSYATVVDKVNPDGNLLVSDRWMTPVGEFGALVNVSYKREAYDYPINWEDTPHNPEPTSQTGLAEPVFVPFMGSVTTEGWREYPELNASFQFRPNDNTEFYSDWIYTGYKARYGNVNFFSVTSDPHPLTNVTLVPNGCVTLTGGYGCEVQTATVTDPYTASSNQAFDEHEDDLHGNFGMKFHEGGLSLQSEFSFTTSYFKQTREIVDISLNNEVTTLNSLVNGHGTWSLSGPDPTVMSNYYLQNLNESWTRDSGGEIAWDTRGHYSFASGPITLVEGGFRFADRKATSEGVAGGDVGECVPGPTPGSCNDGNVSALATFGPSFFQMFRGGDGNPAQFLSESTNFLLDNAREIRAFYDAPLSGPPADPAATFSDDETTAALWGQAKYAIDLGSLPVDGQVGLRVVQTNRTLTGTDQTTNADGSITYTPYSTPSHATDWLPNVSARLHLTDDLQMHLSYADTVTRPDFGALNPALSITPPTVNRQGNGSEGNPNLAPTKSEAFDVTLEYYFHGNGYASIATFYHNVDGYIEPETVTQPYDSAYCTANGIPTTGGLAGQCNVIIGTSASSGKGYIRGAEVAAQKFFDWLPGAWSGFGLQANYTWLDSRAPIPGQNGLPTIEGQLTNVSKSNASVIAMYEKYGWQIRLAGTYRSKYIESYYPGNDTYPPEDVVKPTTYVDLGVNYAWSSKITLSMSATNLLHAYYNSYSGTTLFPRDIRTADETLMLGIHYRLN